MSHAMAQNPRGAIPPEELRHRLTRAREFAGLTRIEIADALQIGRNSVGRYESGDRVPSRAVVLGWSLVTGVDPQWLQAGAPPGGAPGPITMENPHFEGMWRPHAIGWPLCPSILDTFDAERADRLIPGAA